MKKTLILAAAAAFLAAPAFAVTMTIEFAGDDGTTLAVTLDDATGTATMNGVTMPYTWDAEAMTLCAAAPEGDVCATFAEQTEPVVGASSAYTSTTGNSGTATITAIAE